MSDPDTSTSQLLNNLFSGCWSCGAFNMLGQIGLNFADTVFSQTASGMTILIGLFTALWILWFAAKLFLPFGGPGAGHWNMGAAKLFKLMVVLAFLQTSGPFWNYIFVPILSTGLGIASQLAVSADPFEGKYGVSGGVPAGKGSGVIDYCSGSPAPPDPKIPLSDNVQAAFSALEQMDCPMSKMQGAYAKGMMIGAAAMAQMDCDPDKGTWKIHFLPTLHPIVSFTAGLIVIAAFLWGFLVFPLLLIDVLARVILVAAISPVAIAATLFKPTSRIAERSVWTLLHCGLTLMFGAVVAGISKALISYILAQMSRTGVDLTTWKGLSTTMENACTPGFSVDFVSSSFYMLIGTAVITIYMMRKASALAAELTGISGSTGAQAAVATMAGAAAGVAGRAAQNVYKRLRDDAVEKAKLVTGNDQNSGQRSDRNRSGKVSGADPD